MLTLLLLSCVLLASSGLSFTSAVPNFQRVRVRHPVDRLFDDTYIQRVRNQFSYGAYGDTTRMINRIKQSFPNPTHQIHYPYEYVAATVRRNRNGTDVVLPLVVEATLTNRKPSNFRTSSEITTAGRNNVRAMYDLGNNDSLGRIGIDVGHIVAFMNGGSTDIYNFVGQTARLNRGPWRAMETEINKWLLLEDVFATFAVAVEYDTVQQTRPVAFYVKVDLFEADGRVHSDLQDMVFRNV